MNSELKVALVTGGAKGIGAEYSKALANNKFRVVVADIDLDAINATIRQIRNNGGEAIGIQVDVSSWSEVEEMITEVKNTYKRIDVLVNNAALYAVIEKKSILDISDEEWDRVMHVNVKGTFNCCKAVIPLMKKNGGKIINISSSTVFSGTPGFVHYVSSKAALIGFTRSLAREIGTQGITVNNIAPGLTRSGSNNNLTDEYFENIAAKTCLDRVQVPSDLVGMLLFLSSEGSDYITGQTLVVDGGMVMN